MKHATTIHTRDDLDDLFLRLREAVEDRPQDVVWQPVKKQRTLQQNAALHKWCELMATQMNDAGYTQRQLVGQFKDGFELPVTEHMVKDIFREVGRAMFKKDSTADLTTTEVQEVYQVVDARFGEITGCRTEWPSREAPPLGER